MEVCASTEPADSHLDGMTVRCHLADPPSAAEIDFFNPQPRCSNHECSYIER